MHLSQASDRSSPAPANNLASSLLDLDWDPYEPLQHSTDNLAVPAKNLASSSNSFNMDVNHNRSDFVPKYEDGEVRLNSSASFIKFADPTKKQFSSKQKVMLQKLKV